MADYYYTDSMCNTVSKHMVHVSKEEFDKFLEAYPRYLDMNHYAVCDPPAISYNDFELASMWPDSIVAETYAYSDNPDDRYYVSQEDRIYRICENYEDVFNSKHDVFLENIKPRHIVIRSDNPSTRLANFQISYNPYGCVCEDLSQYPYLHLLKIWKNNTNYQ